MKLQDTLDDYRLGVRIFTEIVESGAIAVGPDGFRVYNRPGLSEPAMQTLMRLIERPADIIETYSYGKLISEGAKVFRPTQEQLEMLEQVQINIPIADYVQPYPTLAVEFPEGYFAKKRVHCPQAGQWFYGRQIRASHEPGYVIVRHDGPYVFATAVFTSGLSIKTSLHAGRGETIDEIIEAFTDGDDFRNSMNTTKDEWKVTKSCVRSALNYCLLLDEVGCRQVSTPAVQRHPDGRKLNRAERRERQFNPQAVLWELAQDVKLYRTVDRHDELPGEVGGGSTMPPHHRRGHYRMQRHGVGLALKKRIRIAPVFVNSHLFFGRPCDATATYRS